jgi:hypothetical protein
MASLINFSDFDIKVVPLEIQLESNLRRNRTARTESIISRLKERGYESNLLEQALSKENLETVKANYKL